MYFVGVWAVDVEDCGADGLLVWALLGDLLWALFLSTLSAQLLGQDFFFGFA